MAATPASDQAFHRDRADRSVLVGRARGRLTTIVRLVESLHRWSQRTCSWSRAIPASASPGS